MIPSIIEKRGTMTLELLRDQIQAIGELQTEEQFILAGIFLKPAAIELLGLELTPDDPPIGAIGRYLGVPIFQLSQFPYSVKLRSGELNGIPYQFIEMDHVD